MSIKKTISKSILYGILFWSWFNFIGAGISPLFYADSAKPPSDNITSPETFGWEDEDMPIGSEANFQNNPFDIGTSLYRSANMTCNSGTIYPVGFNIENWDTDTLHSTEASLQSKVTFNHKGRYALFGQAYWEHKPNAGYLYLGFRKNGSEQIMWQSMRRESVGGAALESASGSYVFNKGDYVEMVVLQDTLVAVKVLNVASYCPRFIVQRIGMGVDFMIVALAFSTIMMLSLLVINVFYKQPAFKFAIFFLCIAIAALYYQADLEGNAFVTVAVMIIGGYNLWAMTKAEKRS